jgi:hypothetical protein
VLAWQSIVADVKDGRLNLDQHQARQASGALDTANEGLGRMVRETYKWLLVPMQEVKPGKGPGETQWEHFQINAAAVNRTEEIEKILKEHELLISDWAPIHLATFLKTWFWKDDVKAVNAQQFWQKTCCYLYLPRLKDDNTLSHTISAGASSRDFFGLAYGESEGRYQGFQFAHSTSVIFDSSLLLIEPKAADEFANKLLAEEAERQAKIKATTGEQGTPTPSATSSTSQTSSVGVASTPTATPTMNVGAGPAAKKHTFYATVDLDPLRPKLQFSEIADEVLMLFTQRPDAKVRVSIQIEAESTSGFDEGMQRSVKENCDQLKIVKKEFGD